MGQLLKKLFWYVAVPLGLVYLVVVKGPELMDKAGKSQIEKNEQMEEEVNRRANRAVDRNWAGATGSPPKVDTQKSRRIADDYNKKLGERLNSED